jgi:PIN domain nuclease of toxin-antitoxin system
LRELLLDTHILLWILREPARLSSGQREAIDGAALRFVSAASLYEIGQKAMLGKLDLDPEDIAALPDDLPGWGMRWLPLDERTMARASLATWGHRDPFDRMILAAAEIHDLPLVTSDARLSGEDSPFDVRLVA